MSDSKSVIPLESNPVIFTDLAHKLGLSSVLEFHDVYSLTDPDLLAFLPSPVYGVILLFPLSPNYEKYRAEQDHQTDVSYNNELLDVVHWYKQTIRNGCGLYALLHVLSNLPKEFLIKNSKLESLLAHVDSSGPNISVDEISKLVEELEASIKLDENYGSQGQTEAPSANSSIEFHFITYIKGRNNRIYELDGRRKGPVDLGQSDDDGHLLSDSKVAEKIQFYIDNADEANKHNFALMAIGPSLD